MGPPRFRDRVSKAIIKSGPDNLKLSFSSANGSSTYLPWVLKHSPRSIDDVAIHPSKSKEILNRLDPKSNTRVLILSGPAGSSKSTIIRKIADKRGQLTVEYQLPDSNVGSTSLKSSFHEFLLGASMYDRENTVILVDELPSIFHEETRQEFEDALISWAQEPGQPVVAVVMTEIETSAKYNEAIVVPRIFGSLLNFDSTVAWVKTNPVNSTLLQRQLRSIATAEGLNLPAPVLKALGQSGDVRSAVNALEFYSRAPTSNVSSPTDLWVRGSPVELFYAIGKVIWTSSKEGSLEESLDGFSDTMGTFNLTVLENYTTAKHQRLPISAASEITEWLSLADTERVDPKLAALGAADVISRCSEVSNLPKKFVTSKFTQFPKWQTKKHLEFAKLQGTVRSMRKVTRLSMEDVLMDYKPFTLHIESVRRKTPVFLENSDSDDDF